MNAVVSFETLILSHIDVQAHRQPALEGERGDERGDVGPHPAAEHGGPEGDAGRRHVPLAGDVVRPQSPDHDGDLQRIVSR